VESLVVQRLSVGGIDARDPVILDHAPPLPARNPAPFPGHVVTPVVHHVTLLPVQTPPVPHKSR